MITAHSRRYGFALAVLVALVAPFTTTGSARAGQAPVKEIESARFGWEVDKTTKADICTVVSKDECQLGSPSGEAGGFFYPEALAGAPGGNVYVADRGNARIDELKPDGTFVEMFGREVNKKGGDLCTAAELAECTVGVKGSAPGEFSEGLQSIAVDPVSGNVYVAESAGGADRVQEFGPDGTFVLEIGRAVNETKGTNVCTAEEEKGEGVECGSAGTIVSPEPGVFNFPQDSKNMLVAGGPEDLLYVGDEHRVQEFDSKTGSTNGQYKREISLSPISQAVAADVDNLAVDPNGHVYLVYGAEHELVREMQSSGGLVATFATSFVFALAVDLTGRLAISEYIGGVPRGAIYENVEVEAGVRKLHQITEFPSRGTNNLAFNSTGDMFAAFQGGTSLSPEKHEVLSYRPVPVGELKAISATCGAGPDHETDATVNCSLNGSVESWGVAQTKVWFQYGRTCAFGSETPKQSIKNAKEPSVEGEEEPSVPVTFDIEEVRPHEPGFCYHLVGEDKNAEKPELLSSAPPPPSFTTPSVPPRAVGELLAAYQTPTSAVLFGHVNPENAPTAYEFQYAPEAGCDQSMLAEGKDLAQACTEVQQTGQGQSAQYGPVGVAMEATALQPATVYRYRLYAENEAGEGATDETGHAPVPEGSFETAAKPVVSAVTEGYSALTSTGAVISGSVNPDGQAATYKFELGVANGAATQYGVLFSGSVAAVTGPVKKSLLVTGLQPGTTYAYRIAIAGGFGTAHGLPVNLPTLIALTGAPGPPLVAQLPIPHVKFPEEAKHEAPTRAQKLALALKACAKKPRKQLAACRARAHKRYGTAAKARKGSRLRKRGTGKGARKGKR